MSKVKRLEVYETDVVDDREDAISFVDNPDIIPRVGEYFEDEVSNGKYDFYQVKAVRHKYLKEGRHQVVQLFVSNEI